MARVTLYSDFICPYCYVGERKAAPALETLGLALDWRGYEIHPEIPPEGISAERLRALGLGGRWRRIEAFAAEAGMTIARPARLPSSRLALEGAEHARAAGRLAPYRDRIFRAFFVEGADIGAAGVLETLASEAGLDGAAFRDDLESRRFRTDVDGYRGDAEDLMVTGVPAFFLHGVPVLGARSEPEYLAVFSRILEKRAARDARAGA
ncbi:MAG: DsbA family protein [Myxococcota bacterium]